MALVLQQASCFSPSTQMSNWMLKQKFCRHSGCPLLLTENKNRFVKFGIFSTEADKNIN